MYYNIGTILFILLLKLFFFAQVKQWNNEIQYVGLTTELNEPWNYTDICPFSSYVRLIPLTELNNNASKGTTDNETDTDKETDKETEKFLKWIIILALSACSVRTIKI